MNSHQIETLILEHGTRGVERVRAALAPGYCDRAAALVQAHCARVLIGTGFPVEGTFETDGPVGAIALYRVVERLGGQPVFVCAPPISRALAGGFRTHEVPILDWAASAPVMADALARLRPTMVVSIERPGVAADGRYYNMLGGDITDAVAKLDLLFERAACPTLAIGDGGNEIGMGNVLDALADLPITPSVTRCDELVIAAVSNWGVYGIVAALSRACGEDLFACFDPAEIVAWLVARGAVDGRTGTAAHSEDGFPLEVGLGVIARLRALL